MSFLKLLVDRISYSAMGMSYDRKKALQELNALAETISNHLFLTVHYPGHSAYNHWVHELRGWNILLRRRHKGKHGRKNYTKSVLMKALWFEPLETDEDRKGALEWAVEIKGLPLVGIDDKTLKISIEKYCDNILNNHSYSP